MAKDRRYTLRLFNDVQSELDIIEYLSALPKPRRAEELRAIVKAGFALLNGNVTPVHTHTQFQPSVQPTAAPRMDATTTTKQAAPGSVQEVGRKPTSFPPDHEEEEVHTNDNANESDTGMDAADPLAKMKAKIGG
ncbi:MAG: hypothetical protein G8D89_20655 [gamma proteobacterium symbiont of Clathrolucina costata]